SSAVDRRIGMMIQYMTPVLRAPAKASFAYSHVIFFGVLILVCYAPAVVSLASDWINDENMGHGFFVPPVVAYILWQEKEELKKIRPQTNWWGLLLVLLGAARSLI